MEETDLKDVQLLLNCSIEEYGDKLNIKAPWNDETINIEIENTNENIEKLKNIKLNPVLSAIHHYKENKVEFIFAGVDKDSYFLDLTTEFLYRGQQYRTSYGPPSDTLLLLANGLVDCEASNTNLRNLALIKEAIKKSDPNTKIVSYFIETVDFKEDIVTIAKHINMYAHFYDRKLPHIIFHDTIDWSKVEYEKTDTPPSISMTNIENIILDLLYTANCTQNIRLKYMLTYQVLEYYAYYHFDAEQKSSIESIIRNPDFIYRSYDYTNILIDKMRDFANSNDDKSRLKRLITHYISLDDIKREINKYLTCLMKDLEFDGGFVLPAISSFSENDAKSNFTKFDPKQYDAKQKAILYELVDKCDKIRNVMVHVREYRENKVIYPTQSNHKKIIPYFMILQRMAELVAIRYH